MSSTIPTTYKFSRGLYLDRRRGKYTFRENPETVLVVNAHEAVSVDDLQALYHPYRPGKLTDWKEMVDRAVLASMRSQDSGRPGSAEDEDGSTASTAPPPGDKVLAILGDPELPPAERVGNLRKECRSLMEEWLEDPAGTESVLHGNHDREIREVVLDLCREIKPSQLLRGSEADGATSRRVAEDGRPMEKALTSQAFGNRLDLSEVELFFLAKSAIVQSLSKTGYQRIVDIKQHLLLQGASPSLERKLCMYYQGVERFLDARSVDPEIIELVSDSKFVYLDREVRAIDGRSLSLGVADAFLTLKEASRFTVEILDVLLARLRSCLPPQFSSVVETTEKLLRDTCYNEYRRAADRVMSGGDHREFLPLGRHRRGVVVFDVSAPDRRATEIRDWIVEVLGKVAGRGDPGAVLTLLNRFCFRYPLPRDVLVSMVFAVVDVSDNVLRYANAGDHPPYLVREDRILGLDDAGEMALNVIDAPYRTQQIRLEPRDCLVLYTDPDDRILDDLREQTILRRQLYQRRSREAVDLILAAARDEAFVIEDDVTVQVYRHV